MAVLDALWGDVDVALLALAAGVLWLAAAAWLYARRRPLEPDVGPYTLDLGPEPPALANFLVNGLRPTDEAVPATVIDLAARRYVEVEQRGPGVFFLHLRREPPDGLTRYERRVYDVLLRHASDGVVPADALTTGSEERSKGWRKDFDSEVVTDARARGLARRASQSGAFFALAVAGAAPALPALLASAWGLATVIVTAELVILGWIDVRFPLRETPAGLAATSRWLGVRAALAENPVFDTHSPLQVPLWDRLLAYGAALGVATAAGEPLPLGAEPDTRAWSSYGGAGGRSGSRTRESGRRRGARSAEAPWWEGSLLPSSAPLRSSEPRWICSRPWTTGGTGSGRARPSWRRREQSSSGSRSWSWPSPTSSRRPR
jgi:hypothetical protein